MDTIDRAQSAAETLLADALAAQSRRAARMQLTPCGACHYCGEDVPSGRLFCDSECGWAWEEEQAQRRRMGVTR